MVRSLLFRRHASAALAGATIALVTLAGCASERGGRGDFGGRPEAAAPIPEMEAQGTFLGGTVEVEVVLNRAGFGPREGRAAGGGGGGGERGGIRGGFRGGGLGGGFGGGRRGMRGGGGEGGGRGGYDGETPAPRITASNQPPVALHLRLTNHTASPVEVEVPDFDSDLGNFVVQPAKITVPPNGSAEADPMTSRLGVMAADIPLTVTLRANGQTDHQVLSLHVKAPPPPPAPAS